jgi:Fur family ferric uptake transcriptional regulator
VFDVHRCPGDLAALAPPGFSVDHHEITLYGRCAECRRATRAAPRPAGREATVQRTTPQGRARRTRRTVGEA